MGCGACYPGSPGGCDPRTPIRYTRKCGRCLVSAAKRDGVTLIAVTLSDPNDWNDHTRLLDSGFDLLEAIDVLSAVDIPREIPVISGSKDSIKIGIKPNDRTIVRYKGSSDIEADVQIIPYVTSNVSSGDKVGKIIIKNENNKEIDIIALEEVNIKSKKLPFFAK